MSAALFAIGDFSGIQDYVLDVKTAGDQQASRLRARSFLLELFERAALFQLARRFDIADDDVLVRGGGGFTVRLPAGTDTGKLERLAADLQQRLWKETGGEVNFGLGWGGDTEEARGNLERRKRQPARSLLQRDKRWAIADGAGPLPDQGGCDVCGHSRGQQVRTEAEENPERICDICDRARRIGRNLTRWDWMRPAASPAGGDGDGDGGDGDGGGAVPALGVSFAAAPAGSEAAFRVSRWIPRRDDGRGALLFREIAECGRGDQRLGVLKAVVDDMGVRVGEIAGGDQTYGQLRQFSRALHTFFVDGLQDMLRQSYPLIYTIYAGGDDLLLVGPWDVVLDFVGDLQREFQAGPGQEYGITFSAGVHLAPYRAPIRHAVDQAEELLERAKGREGKNGCAALGALWRWDRHSAIIGDGKRLAEWVKQDGAGRGLLRRLLQLTEASGADPELRAARWSYQVARNLPPRRGETQAAAAAREWANGVLGFFDEPQGRYPAADKAARPAQGNRLKLVETAVSLRYARLATRCGGGDTE